ncbi:MAG: sigma-54 dependent transcriptional regulator [Deltaproteobacteria bacterium]|nr:sigma-54 dependent transcriptional regulator [Deltaproteobacteria bacterium]
MGAGNILVVDDDPNLLELLRIRLESGNYQVTTALKEEEALKAAQEQVFDLSIVDLKLAQGDGITLMQALHLINPQMPVIILTAHGSIESAVEAMRKGAYSYLTKPFEAQDLFFQMERALENRRLSSEVNRLKNLLKEKYDFDNIVAKSGKMQRVLEMVARIAQTDSTVYIHGESGTGKELIAKAIHLASARKNKAFIALNCAALPETLLESELFGHEKGAFTGAIRSTKGLFTQAHEGSLFLDEIGDMSLSLQAKLLRVLQERQFYPVGSERSVEVDVRVVVATQKDLEEAVKQGGFREDLFYRIHVIPIPLPPLRERKEDIPPLVEHFLKKYNQQMKKEIEGLTPAAMQRLMLHDWPGNVRELENTIEYAVAMAQQNWIKEDLILQTRTLQAPEPLKPLKESKDAFEKTYLTNLLQISEGNVSRAAKLAGKYRADFYDLLKKHGLKTEKFKKTRPEGPT